MLVDSRDIYSHGKISLQSRHNSLDTPLFLGRLARSRIRQRLKQRAEVKKILDPEVCPAGRGDDEGIFSRQISPGERHALQAAVIVVEVGAITPGTTDPAINQAQLAPEEGMEGVSHPEDLTRFRRIRL